jgi:hypothetical protein
MITATPAYQTRRKEMTWREKLQALSIPEKQKAELVAYISETCHVRRKIATSTDQKSIAACVASEFGERAPELAFEMIYIQRFVTGLQNPDDRPFSHEVTRRIGEFLQYFLVEAI